MKNLKQSILVVAALGGAVLCVNVGNAHAEEVLSVEQMTAVSGAATTGFSTPDPKHDKLGKLCNTLKNMSDEDCTERNGVAFLGTCLRRRKLNVLSCSIIGATEYSKCPGARWEGCIEYTYETTTDAKGRRICGDPPFDADTRITAYAIGCSKN